MSEAAYGESWIRDEVASRLKGLRDDPTPVLSYDLDGDGELTEEEWEVVRTVVSAEVCNEARTRKRRMGIRSPDDTSEFPIVEEDEFEPAVDDGDITGEFSFDDFVEIDPEVREEIAGRYTLLRKLGRGGQGDAYLARNTEKTRFVALKELAFERMEAWKALELFRRESQLLEKLDHRGIPGFVETFDVETDRGPRFFLVQQYIEGDNLLVRMKRGEVFDEARLVDIATSVLQILVFLQAFSPPIIHRDVKPANIIERPTGELVLVDFGAVMEVVAPEVGGSTVVGTTGYMPPEQLMGRAHPSSDLFGLGATLVHLSTRCHPTQLEVERMRLCWRSQANVSEVLADFIDRLIEPAVEDRYPAAAEALRDLNEILDGVANDEKYLVPVRARRPAETFVSLERGVEEIVAKFPGPSSTGELAGGVFLGACAAGYGVAALLSTLPLWPAVLPLLILIGVLMSSEPSTILVVNRNWGWRLTRIKHGFRQVETGLLSPEARILWDGKRLVLKDATKSHEVASGLSPDEARWAAEVLGEFVEDNVSVGTRREALR